MTDNLLTDIFGYKKLNEYYIKNKDKIWSEWLEYKETFKKPGKQGLVGLLLPKDKDIKLKYIFKVSQYINYLIFHEHTIMNSLNDLAPYCPHFCKTFGIINCKVDPKKRKKGNPFEIEKSKYPIVKEVLLCEYLENCPKFYDYIKSKKVPEDVIFSTIKQVLMSVIIAQNKKRFTHYDLHSHNIMMKKCDKDYVFLYVIDEDNQFAISTGGCYPIIIDFGFSFIGDMDNNCNLWPSMGHTDVGFMSDRFDHISDAKLFLNSVSTEICDRRTSRNCKKIKRIVKNLFHNLDIDTQSGWDNHDDHSALDYVTEKLEKYNNVSELFKKYEHYCIELIQSLIICPLQKQKHKNIGKVFKIFLNEWVKIENEISDPFYNLYILKGIICSARIVRPMYINKKLRDEANKSFTQLVYSRINEVSKFCHPKKLNTEILLCSLLMLSTSIEGILYEVINKRMNQKNKEYSKLPLPNVQQIYAAIETNLQDKYIYNKDTTIFVFDTIKEKTETFKLKQKHINIINEIHPLCKGTSLYDIYTKRSPV